MKLLKIGTLTIAMFILVLGLYEWLQVEGALSKTEKIKEQYLNDRTLTLNKIPKDWVDILIKIEDPNFYKHDGIDFQTPGAGLTTITQGLTKKMYFEEFKPGFEKIEQSLIARFVVNEKFTKDEQLAIFFNIAYLGHFEGRKVTGFTEASQIYFNSEFEQLSRDQFLSLIAMLVAPNSLNVKNNPKENAERVKRVIKVLEGTYLPNSLTDIYYDREDA